jgi:hypothetical protein
MDLRNTNPVVKWMLSFVAADAVAAVILGVLQLVRTDAIGLVRLWATIAFMPTFYLFSLLDPQFNQMFVPPLLAGMMMHAAIGAGIGLATRRHEMPWRKTIGIAGLTVVGLTVVQFGIMVVLFFTVLF